MKRLLTLLICTALLLSALSSCGGTTEKEPSSGSDTASAQPSESATDSYEGSEPIPLDQAVPENIRLEDGTRIQTIVVPSGFVEDPTLQTAAQELQYHFKLVTGSTLPILSEKAEGYGALILATPDALPTVTELFPDDLAWLADPGSRETGKWASDGFAIRRSGDSVYIIGNISKGALNGAYDLIEEALGVLWVRADEEQGLIYDPLEEAVISHVDYREKSPFEFRGWLHGNASNVQFLARNKVNTTGNWGAAEYGGKSFRALHSMFNTLLSSPLYDPEETEWWETDAEGNSLGREGSNQINPWSEKAVDALAAAVIEQMQTTGERFVFLGEEDAKGVQRCAPYDTQPFEYAPGQFVYPEDENYYSTVFHTMINKIARKVKEAVPDGWIGTFAYNIAQIPPACDMEDNVRICYAAWDEDLSVPILDQSIRENKKDPKAISHCTNLPLWCEKAVSVGLWHYYACAAYGAQFTFPFWGRMQKDFQGYAELGVEAVTTSGIPDYPGEHGLLQYFGIDATAGNFWDMNMLTFWLYHKLLWNPYEDVDALIVYFCDKVYRNASPYMQEYYRLLEQGWTDGQTNKTVTMKTTAYDLYRQFVKKTGIGHALIDTLTLAYEAADGPIRDVIGYTRDSVVSCLSTFKSF